MQCLIYLLLLLLEAVNVESGGIALEFLFNQVLLQVDVVFSASITICLPVASRQNSVENRENEKKCGTNILQYLVLIVRQGRLGNEYTEKSLAPVIVQESEVAFDIAHARLLHGKKYAEEKKIKVHNPFVCILHVYNGESECRDSDQKHC